MPRKGKRSKSQKRLRKLQSSLGTSKSTNSVSGMSDERAICQSHQSIMNKMGYRASTDGFDLDGILQKGDAVYTSFKRGLQSKGKSSVTDLEYLVLKIEPPKQALLPVIYRPPSNNLAEVLANLNTLLTSLVIIDFKPVIVCRGFNEDQLSRLKIKDTHSYLAPGQQKTTLFWILCS
ncbi:Thymidylate kinase [Labeo rohita]|uniref:Thymidylate kinase n=1 Tax=Labeo rohita TaxID=84645 RepID=A0ABQ8M3Y3_LABRO|nr:Thymidylate kinase [Labeo rohita]